MAVPTDAELTTRFLMLQLNAVFDENFIRVIKPSLIMPILDGLELIWGENTTGEHDWYFQREAIMLIRDTFFKSLKEEFLFSVLRLFDVTHASFPNVFGSRLALTNRVHKITYYYKWTFYDDRRSGQNFCAFTYDR